MSNVHVFDSREELASAVAQQTVDILSTAIDTSGQASWVLAGGTAPLAAYQVIATSHVDTLDWSRVTFIMGDERIASSEHSNWQAIDTILKRLPARKFAPNITIPAIESATDYERYLHVLPRADNGLPRFDLVWLGLGEDGHTLSLFPNHASLYPSNKLVVAVENAPKPPANRISLSLRALQGTQNAMIITSGTTKRSAISGALSGNNSPIAIASSIIATHGGEVEWYIDKDAATD